MDSSAWISFFSASDGHHADADAAFRRAYAEKRRMLTTVLVLAETHRLLLYRAGLRPARVALDRISGIELLSIAYPTDKDAVAARAWLDRLSDQTISYADAMSFAVMETSRCNIAFTFDSDFSMAGFSRWSSD